MHSACSAAQLNLRPKRTVRLLMWTSEEFGGIGALQYFNDHKGNVRNYDMVMESDEGVFHPYGLRFTGNAAARAIMQEIGQLLASIDAANVTTGGGGTDIAPWIAAGVPGASLYCANDDYFYYHHTAGDQMTVLDSATMDRATAVWAVFAYVVADLAAMLPR